MYTFDNISLLKNGKPWFPIMGEIHYSRYPKQYWHESLYKMKAGGVDIVSAYVIWIHHEEIEGEYDFTGNKNLNEFVQACKDCGIKLLLRIGPWIHGEVRNGGFPDWLLKKDFQVRTNDEKYFSTIKTWYKKIFQQVENFFTDNDTNPIIGIQIENEFGHCGGLYDETGEIHMQKLKQMAEEIGFKVPLYTATGWGGARTGGLLPVMGGYCDAPWDPSTEEIEPSGNFIFTHERNDHNIGSDYGLGHGITFDTTKFPYLTAELGGGLQVTKHRRTIATAKDIGAVSLTKLGSGVNLLGYYMYHGGTNPDGKLTTLQESTETGYPNDLPIKSYDFRAPIREFGQISETYKELKLLTYFVHDFGEEFCKLPAIIPEDNPLKPSDTDHLRYAFRSDGNKGYLFINNYVRHQNLKDFPNCKIKIPDGTQEFMLSIQNKDFFFLPFNIDFAGTKVQTAVVTPFCCLKDGTTVFYANSHETKGSDFFKLENSEVIPKFLVLSRESALNTWKTPDGNLIITEGNIVIKVNGEIYLTGRKQLSLASYKKLEKIPEDFLEKSIVNKNFAKDLPCYLFTNYEKKSEIESGNLTAKLEAESSANKSYSLDITGLMNKLKQTPDYSDCFIQISYMGDSAKLYGLQNGKKVLIYDNFYLGKNYPWEIGLKRFLNQDFDYSQLKLEISSLQENQKIYLEEKPEFVNGIICSLNAITYQFEATVKLN